MQSAEKSRIFASNYQMVVCDNPLAFSEDSNWTDSDVVNGFAGNSHYRMIGTEADLNDHWVELATSEKPPTVTEWERITCVSLRCDTGKIHVMSVIDDEPAMTMTTPPGDYSIYVAGNNIGVDQLSLGEDFELTDDELANRKDLEWYRVFVIPGQPPKTGRL